MDHPHRNILLSAALVAASTSGGCSSAKAPVSHYVLSPMGYVSPELNEDGSPVEFGPEPVPVVYTGRPRIVLQAASSPIQVTVDDQRFTPAQITAMPGQIVTIQLVNQGLRQHGIVLDFPNAVAEPTQFVAPDRAGIIQFTAPINPGPYRFTSTTSAMQKNGPVGTLIVSPRSP